MTPLQIEIMLFYYRFGASPSTAMQFPRVNDNTAPAVVEQAGALAAVDMLAFRQDGNEITSRAYFITARGNAYVEALQLVPVPMSSFRIEWPTIENIAFKVFCGGVGGVGDKS